METAIRETFEETDVRLQRFNMLQTDYIADKYIGLNNVVYENVLWRVKLDAPKGFLPVLKEDVIEIKKAAWVKREELKKYLKPEKHFTIPD